MAGSSSGLGWVLHMTMVNYRSPGQLSLWKLADGVVSCSPGGQLGLFLMTKSERVEMVITSTTVCRPKLVTGPVQIQDIGKYTPLLIGEIFKALVLREG